MSVQSRVCFGFGFGALAVVGMGFLQVEEPAQPAPQATFGGYYGNIKRSDTRQRDYLAQAKSDDSEMVHLITTILSKGLL